MDISLTREMLQNVARWRSSSVVVYANLSNSFCEKRLEIIIGDMTLLANVGINMIFVCRGDNKKLLQLARAQNIDAYNIKDRKDVLEISQRLGAVKLFFLCEVDGVFDKNGLIGEMTITEAKQLLKESGVITGSMREKMQLAIQACSQKVQRVHFVNGKKGGAFLEEILSGKGSGTMIYNDTPPYKTIRPAKKTDTSNIARVLRDSLDCSATSESVARSLECFTVFTVDDHVHAAMKVVFYDNTVEVDYLASSSDEKFKAIHKLLLLAIAEAKKQQQKNIFIPITKAPTLIGIQPWFLKLGFKSQPLKTKRHNHTKVWFKSL